MSNRDITATTRSTERLAYAKSVATNSTSKTCFISGNFCQLSIEENFCLFRLFTWTMLLFSVLAVLFLAYPEIDLYFANLFYAGEHQFLLQTKNIAPYAKMIRYGLQLIFVAACIGAGLLLINALRMRRKLNLHKANKNSARFKAQQINRTAIKSATFLLLAFILGPGIITNMVFKDNWGRARPNQVVEFGGVKPFTPPLLMRANCERNCSFVSGEASTIYILFFALSLVLRRWRYQLIIAGVIAGTFSGLVRMGLGGHFLSDVLFAGIFMSFTALFSYWLVFGTALKSSPISPYYRSALQQLQIQFQSTILKNIYPIGTLAALPTYTQENKLQE